MAVYQLPVADAATVGAEAASLPSAKIVDLEVDQSGLLTKVHFSTTIHWCCQEIDIEYPNDWKTSEGCARRL